MKPDYDSSLKFSEMSDEKGEIIGSMGTIYLTGAGYYEYPFVGISPESKFGWQEMVWKKSPNRGSSFAFTNMDDIDVGLVARCEISIKYMNYNDYMVLRQFARQRHFEVKFFDVDDGIWITREMYFTESSLTKLLTLKQSLIGVLDTTLKLVGTNRDMESVEYTVTYNATDITSNNSGTGTVNITPQTYPRGDQVDIASNVTPPTGKHLKYWVTVDSNKNITGYYLPSSASSLGGEALYSITLWQNLDLYPIWE